MRSIEIYTFQLDDTIWRYTSGNITVNYDGNDFAPLPISRSAYETRHELSKNGMDITIPITNELAQLLLTEFAEFELTLLIGQLVSDYPDFSTNVGYRDLWQGRMTATRPSGNKMKLVFETYFTSMRRQGCRARYSKNCRHVLYSDMGCKVDPLDYELEIALTGMSGDREELYTDDIGSAEAGYYIGGILLGPGGTRASIIGQSETSLTIQRPLDELTGTENVKIYPGCNHAMDHCKDRFSNLENYGGYPYIPSDNPFGKTIA